MKAALEPGWSLLSRTSIGIALVALATVVCLRIPGINATTAGFVYLIVVLGVAARWGFRESLVVSVAANLAFQLLLLSSGQYVHGRGSPELDRARRFPGDGYRGKPSLGTGAGASG
jgi:K+-sensing histidine kinase KdpD